MTSGQVRWVGGPGFPLILPSKDCATGPRAFRPKCALAAADAIGNGKIVSLRSVLETLWNQPNTAHTSAGNALLQFDVGQVGGLVKAHLNAGDFRERFLCQPAKSETGPWLTNLVDVLKVRGENNWL